MMKDFFEKNKSGAMSYSLIKKIQPFTLNKKTLRLKISLDEIYPKMLQFIFELRFLFFKSDFHEFN